MLAELDCIFPLNQVTSPSSTHIRIDRIPSGYRNRPTAFQVFDERPIKMVAGIFNLVLIAFRNRRHSMRRAARIFVAESISTGYLRQFNKPVKNVTAELIINRRMADLWGVVIVASAEEHFKHLNHVSC